MKGLKLKKKRTARRRFSIKNRIKNSSKRMRLCVTRSNKNFFVQIIDDTKGHTIISCSTLGKDFPEIKNKCNIAAAKTLGKMLAEYAVQTGIKQVVFDRNGYLYHGKIKAFADSARENGLDF